MLRREFMGFLSSLGLLGLSEKSGVKKVQCDSSLFIVTMSDFLEPSSEQLAEIRKKLEGEYGGKWIICPPGVDIHPVLSPGMVYHREKLDGGEVEIVASSEKDLRERLKR